MLSNYFESFTVATTTWLTVTEYLCHKWPLVPLVVSTWRSFPHSWLITGFVTRITRRVPLVGQELLIRSEHMSSPPVFGGVGSVDFCVVLCRSLFVLLSFFFWPLCCLSFSFGHCVVCLFLLATVLSGLLLFVSSDFPFGIFKLFLNIWFWHRKTKQNNDRPRFPLW